MNFRINWQALGVAASVACAIHCAMMPLLITALPLIGSGFFASKLFEALLLFFAFVIGVYGLSHGYRKHHHRLVPLVVFSTGMVLFGLHQWFSFTLAGWLLMISGSAFILLAHVLNFRLCRKANHCHASDCNH